MRKGSLCDRERETCARLRKDKKNNISETMTRKKAIRLTAIAAAIVIAAAVIFSLTDRKPDGDGISYATVTVRYGDISDSVTATGSIEPVTEVEVGTQVSGIIDKIYVDYNSTVREGQLIAEMDKVTLESELASARAAYEGSKAEYEYRKKNFERDEKLAEKNLISESEYDQSLYEYRLAESTLHSNEAALGKAERNLSYAIITSPIDGVVIDRAVEEGQTVAAGFETPTLFTIAADLTRMQVVADVDEADIGGVREGQRVAFTVDAYPDDVFAGEVTQIRLGSSEGSSSGSVSSTSESVVTYEVVISARNPELKLKPRLTANISIYTVDRQNVLCVPSKALRFTPGPPLAGKDAVIRDCIGKTKVWTYSAADKTFTAIPVETGISNGTMTEITAGLKAGDVIVTEAVITGLKMPVPAGNAERSPFMPGPR